MHSRPRSEGGRGGAVASSEMRRSCNRLYDLVELEDSGPRRPRTTPKPRVQRLLLGPSHEALPDYASNAGTQAPACFMTHLPDSPPKSKSSMSPRNPIAISTRPRTGEKALLKETDDGKMSDPNGSSTPTSCDTFTPTSQSSSDQVPALVGGNESGDEDSSSGSWQDEQSEFEEPIELRAGSDYGEDVGRGGVSSDRCTSGPALDDIASPPDNSDTVNPDEESESEIQAGMICVDGDNEALDTPADDSDEDDDGYMADLVDRERILADASDRLRLRSELESYITSLKVRKDEDGEAVVEFPKNYNQILALMTAKDIRIEDESTQQNWARVLIQTGLSKQQAFGSLEDEDGNSSSEQGLAAKIALKMAQINRLDVVLEEKFGPSLYKAIPQRNKKPGRNQESDTATGPPRAFMTQQAPYVTKSRDSTANGSLASSTLNGDIASISGNQSLKAGGRRKNLHFVERNKEVAANGMRAHMTRAEEDRLSRLLEDEESPSKSNSSGDVKPLSELPNAPNEFAMNMAEKTAIAQLLASKPALSQQSIMVELDDAAALDGILEDEEADSTAPLRPGTKKQRLRLKRINQELRFLEETPNISILCDDEYISNEVDHEGIEDTAVDSDCRSERSFRSLMSAGGMSTASSMCSTRSGVISRREFRQFVAEQKAALRSAPTASHDEIQRLLGSISRSSTPVGALTAPVS